MDYMDYTNYMNFCAAHIGGIKRPRAGNVLKIR